ncbi:MAG: AAA family ATPase [Oscillospiraceae bacterium]|nr:AAA family ATPase [Candidatus Ruminococcus equi]
MGKAVLVYGKSGSGKSRSLKNFAEDEIFLINVIKKDLPFRKKFKYEIATTDYDKIKNALYKMPTKVAVIDDAGYLQTSMFMKGHSSPKKGSTTFDLYNNIGDEFWGLLNFIKDQLNDDVIVYILMHETSNDYGEVKLRTIGKLLDEKVCIEGLCTIVLRCISDGTRHYFRTQTDGNDISKSPEEMFDLEIENDLKFVDDTVREFYGMKNNKK